MAAARCVRVPIGGQSRRVAVRFDHAMGEKPIVRFWLFEGLLRCHMRPPVSGGEICPRWTGCPGSADRR